MSVDALIFWLFVAACVVIGALLVFVQVPRIVREARGIIGHVVKLSEPSPLSLQFSKAESDLGRIENALAQVPVLQDRARAALAVVRETQLVPPELAQFVRRVRREFAAFRAARR
jgi:hypothetical protein